MTPGILFKLLNRLNLSLDDSYQILRFNRTFGLAISDCIDILSILSDLVRVILADPFI